MKEIEKIIAAYHKTDWNLEKAAIGTVVKVEESAYRRVGARMYVSSLGHWVGGISGGCLEGDALKRAQIAIYNNESSIVVYDTTDDDSHDIGVGLGCNGRIEVLFTPIHKDVQDNPIEFLKTITATRKTEVILQVLTNSHQDKSILGSFSPKKDVDALANRIEVAQDTLSDCIQKAIIKRKSKVFNIKNDNDVSFDILVELLQPKVKLICVGDNYDVDAFVKIADELGWEIHVAGHHRKLSKSVFDHAAKTYAYDEVDQITLDEHTAVVLMSHDYHKDLVALRHFATTSVPYIGLLGPKKRMLKMDTEFKDCSHL